MNPYESRVKSEGSEVRFKNLNNSHKRLRTPLLIVNFETELLIAKFYEYSD